MIPRRRFEGLSAAALLTHGSLGGENAARLCMDHGDGFCR